MKERDVLVKAKEYIKDENYLAARELLKKIPHSTVAQQWMGKIDSIIGEENEFESLLKTEVKTEPRYYWFGVFAASITSALAGFILGLALASGKTDLSDVNPIGNCEANWWEDHGNPAVVEFLDTAETGSQTSRGSLSGVVLELQRSQRAFEALDYPTCVQVERDLVNDGMESAVDGYNNFLGDVEVLADLDFSNASQDFADAYYSLFDKSIFIDTRATNTALFIWGGSTPVRNYQ